jgi:hypothetical protein
LPSFSSADVYQSGLADRALESILTKLIGLAESDLLVASVNKPSPAESTRITKRFELLVPPERVACLSDIVNAGWEAIESDTFWENNSDLRSRKEDIIKELMLKSIEIFEIEEIVREN